MFLFLGPLLMLPYTLLRSYGGTFPGFSRVLYLAERTVVSYTCLSVSSEHPHVDPVIVRSALTMWAALASIERICAYYLSVKSSRILRTRISFLEPTLCPSSLTSALILNFLFMRLKWISLYLLKQNCDPCLFAHF